jgi:hypothetical protein
MVLVILHPKAKPLGTYLGLVYQEKDPNMNGLDIVSNIYHGLMVKIEPTTICKVARSPNFLD